MSIVNEKNTACKVFPEVHGHPDVHSETNARKAFERVALLKQGRQTDRNANDS